MKETGDGLHSGDGPQVSLSSQTSFSGQGYCARHAGGSKMYRTCEAGLRNRSENRACGRCTRSVLEELV